MFATLVEMVRDMPRFYALKMWRWVARGHTAIDVGPPHHAWCRLCNKPWPCQDWMVATDAITKLWRAAP